MPSFSEKCFTSLACAVAATFVVVTVRKKLKKHSTAQKIPNQEKIIQTLLFDGQLRMIVKLLQEECMKVCTKFSFL